MATQFKVVVKFEDEEGLDIKGMTDEERAMGKWKKTSVGADCDMGEVTIEEFESKLAVYGIELDDKEREQIRQVKAGEKLTVTAGRWGDYRIEGVR